MRVAFFLLDSVSLSLCGARRQVLGAVGAVGGGVAAWVTDPLSPCAQQTPPLPRFPSAWNLFNKIQKILSTLFYFSVLFAPFASFNTRVAQTNSLSARCSSTLTHFVSDFQLCSY